MRKTITLLLLALLTSVGAWAEAETATATVLAQDFSTCGSTVPFTNAFNGKNGYTAAWTINNEVLQAYSNVNGGRSGYVDFGYPTTSITDNWQLSFDCSIAPCTGGAGQQMVVTAEKTANITANSQITSGAYLILTNTDAGSTTYNVVIGSTALNETVTLTSGTMYTYSLSCTNANTNAATLDIVITDGTNEILKTSHTIDAIALGYPRGFFDFNPKNAGTEKFDNILLTKEVEAGVCETPTYAITGVDGDARKFTLSCATPNSTIYYATTELEVGAEGWLEYDKEVTTKAVKIYAYAAAGTANSDIINFATGAGTALVLNAPVATKTAYSNGSYTVTLNSDQSNLSIQPTSVTYKYSINGAAEQSGATITVPEGSTLTAYVSASGYTSSSTTTCETTVRPTGVQVWTQNYTNLVSGSTGPQTITLTETEGGDFTVGDMAFYNITGYTGTEISELNTNVGLNTASYFYFRTNGNNSGILKNANNGGSTGYIGIQNLTPGQYIVITTNGNSLSATEGCEDNLGMNTTGEYYFKATATEASIFFQHGTYNYVKTIAVYDEVETVTVAEEGTSTYVTKHALDFSDVEGLTVLIATDETQGYVELSKVSQVPAGAPIIVKGEAGDYSVPVCDATTYSDNLTNKLSGSATASYTVEAGDNIYAIKKDKSEFRPVAAGVEIPAKKAYFKSGFPINADAKPFIIRGEEEDPTAVSTVEVVEAAKAKKFFNAAGQQVDENYKGFVITSAGKKIINK